MLFSLLQKQEQLRLAKIQSLQKTDLTNAMESFAQTQKDLEETTKTKEEIAAENREKKLKEKLAKLQLKKEHAAEVRRRKAEAAAAAAEANSKAAHEDGVASEGTPSEKSGHFDRGDASANVKPTAGISHGAAVNTASSFYDD